MYLIMDTMLNMESNKESPEKEPRKVVPADEVSVRRMLKNIGMDELKKRQKEDDKEFLKKIRKELDDIPDEKLTLIKK
jgi:uncharacterized iron-regulated protein